MRRVMDKLDFTGVRLIVAGTCFIDAGTILEAGDIIHSIEHKLDDNGNHLGFEFSVEGKEKRYVDSLLYSPLYDESYEDINKAIAVEAKISSMMEELSRLHREWAKSQPTFGNRIMKLLNVDAKYY
jgi:hypothetical protein